MQKGKQSLQNLEQIEELEPLQGSYGENKLVLLIRDPGCLFAYWELTQEFRSIIELHFQIPWEQVQLLVRLNVDLNGNGQSLDLVSEIPIDKLANNWYFNVEKGRRFQVILGLRGPGGEFIPLLESNLVVFSDNINFPTLIPQNQLGNSSEKSPSIPIPNATQDYEYPLGIYSASHLPK